MSRWPRLTERIEGELVVVEPLASTHEDGLFAAGQNLDVWRYLTAFPNACENPGAFSSLFVEGHGRHREGTEGGWAIIDRRSGAPIGSTRYLALRPEHHGLEIGWTWIGKSWWRT